MTTAVEDVLSAWREAEALLEHLPALDPDHETMALEVASLRATYFTLVALSTDAGVSLISTLDTTARARDLIRRIIEKHGTAA